MKNQTTHSALVRGEDGGLNVRRFTSRADAAAAEGSREVSPALATASKRGWSTSRVAKLIGVSQRTIIRRCHDGVIPNTDHGTLGEARFTIAPEAVRLIRVHGLRGLARLRHAGACLIAVAATVLCAPRAEARIEQGPPVAVAIEALPEGSGLLRIDGRSMVPHLQPGTLVSVEAVTMGEVRVGDVIVFHNWRLGKLVAHRVVRSYGQFWVTKGDANFDEDARLVSAKNLRFRVRGAVVASASAR